MARGTASKLEPGRSQVVEDWLSERSIPFVFLGAVPVEEFDIEKGLRNQARLGKPVDEATVARYVEARKNGATFPGVVAVRDKSGRLNIVDGNHRLASAQLTGQPVYAYEITASPQMTVTLTFEANTTHGLPTSEEERLHQGLWMLDNGMSIKDAAARLGLRPELLTRERHKADANRRAVEVGVSVRDWESLSSSVRQRLQNVSTDEGFGEAVKLVRAAALGIDAVQELVTEVNKSRSAQKQIEIVNAFREVYSERIASGIGDTGRKQGKRTSSPRSRYASALGFALVLPDPEMIVGRFQPVECPAEIEKIDQAIDRLTTLRDAFVAAEKDGPK